MPCRPPAIDARLKALDAMTSDGRPRSAIELACVERQRQDLLTGHKRGLIWNEAEVEKMLGVCSLIKHWKGRAAGTPFTPEPWQEHLVFAPLYGWYRETDDGVRRRFRSGYCEVPRKNGKTFMTAGIGIKGLAADHEPGPEVYSAASAREQATRLFDDMQKAVLNSRTLSNRIEARAHSLLGKHNNGVARAVSAEAKTLHGLNPSVGLLDELHAHKDDKVYEAILTGMGARDNPLLFMITTAGSGRTSVCWEQRELARNILEGHTQADTHFAFVATADMEADLQDPATWWMANPNLGVSIYEDFLRAEAKLAATVPSKENSFRNLHLNQWVEQRTRWIPMAAWDACNDTITDEELQGRRCYAGIDFANTRDVNAMVLLFPLDDGRYATKCWFWAPEDEMNDRAERDRKHVRHWMEKGLITGTMGNTIDVSRVACEMADILLRHNVQQAVYDPWGPAEGIRQRMIDEHSVPSELMSELRQTVGNLAGPTKELERLIFGKQLIHNGNEVLRWMMSNVAVKEDAGGNLRPDKGKSADKIDGIVAMIMALTACIWMESPGTSVYEERGVLVL